MLIGFGFTVATVLLSSAVLTMLRGPMNALFCGSVLIGSALFIRHGNAQYADVPLSFFILTNVVSICLYYHYDRKKRGFLFIAGIAAGLAAWTKNEGMLFVLAVLFIQFVHGLIKKDNITLILKECLLVVSGLLPLLIMLAFFKVTMAPQNDLVAMIDLKSIVQRLIDLDRYLLIVRGYVIESIRLLKYQIPIIILTLLYSRFLPNDKYRPATQICFFTLLTVLAGYFSVFLMTHQELSWQLNTTLYRLLIQILPAGLFVLFLAQKFNSVEGVNKLREHSH